MVAAPGLSVSLRVSRLACLHHTTTACCTLKSNALILHARDSQINVPVRNIMSQQTFDLNSTHSLTVKDAFRKTLLHQDIIFRNQVQELHRLYSMQKILMEDICFKQFDTCTLNKTCTQSTRLFYSSKPIRRESSPSLIQDAKLSSTAMDGSTLANSQVLPHRHNNIYNSIHPKPFGLQLCPDQCASRVDQGMLNLSLSVVEEDKRIKATASTCLDQKEKSCTLDYIDLEVSTEEILNEEGTRAASTVTALTKCESQVSVLSSMMGNTSCPFGDGEYSLEFQDCHKTLMAKKSSLKDHSYYETGKLDLNQVQLDDDSSCYSSEKTYHSTVSSLHIFGVPFYRSPETTSPAATWRKESNKFLFDASDIHRWDDAVNSVVMDYNNTSEISDPNCKFVSTTRIGTCKDPSYCTSDPANKYTGYSWRLSDGQFTDQHGTYMATKMLHSENVKDDEISCACQNSTAEKHEDGNMLPDLCDNSGSIKARQPQISLGDTNVITHDQCVGNDDGSELGPDYPKKLDLPEASISIQTAASLLINFALGSLSSYQDCSLKEETIEVHNNEMEKPERSDSFEQIVLNLEECNADDCAVSSKPYEIDSTEKKDFGFRLKRGRRFKDFQKEILPGLTSLSKHEIQEDVNILKAVLRSREYRKIRARTGEQRSWCAYTRSGRSKRNYVRRKIF